MMCFCEDRASIVIIVFDVDFAPGFDFAFDFASTNIIIIGPDSKARWATNINVHALPERCGMHHGITRRFGTFTATPE